MEEILCGNGTSNRCTGLGRKVSNLVCVKGLVLLAHEESCL